MRAKSISICLACLLPAAAAGCCGTLTVTPYDGSCFCFGSATADGAGSWQPRRHASPQPAEPAATPAVWKPHFRLLPVPMHPAVAGGFANPGADPVPVSPDDAAQLPPVTEPFVPVQPETLPPQANGEDGDASDAPQPDGHALPRALVPLLDAEPLRKPDGPAADVPDESNR